MSREVAEVSGRAVVGLFVVGVAFTVTTLGWLASGEPGLAAVAFLGILLAVKVSLGAGLYFTGRAVTRGIERRRVLRSRRADRRVGTLSVAAPDGALAEVERARETT